MGEGKKRMFEVILAVSICALESNVCEVKKLSLIVQDEQCVRETCSFVQGLLPPSLYLGRHDLTHGTHILISGTTKIHYNPPPPT